MMMAVTPTTKSRLFSFAAFVALVVFMSCGATAFVPTTTIPACSRISSSSSSSRSQLQVVPGGGMDITIVDPSYNLAIGAFGVGLVSGFLEDLKGSDGVTKRPTAKVFGVLALLFTLFAVFLAVQTTTFRFTFDDTSFSLVRSSDGSSFDNVKVGGENRWAYGNFQNWDFLPSQDLPMLVYFKETQTPLENRAEVPLVMDDRPGQVHFFPAIANTQQLEQGFRLHKCAKVE